MDNSYKLIEQIILQEMEYRGSRQKQNIQQDKKEKTERTIAKFEMFMNRIFAFDLTQRVGKEKGMASQREFGQLLLSGLGPLGSTYEQRIKNLQSILDAESSDKSVAGIFSGLTVAKIMHTLLYDMNQRKAGNAFEVFMSVLMNGSIEETYGQAGSRGKEDYDIIDLTAPIGDGRERYSLKFVTAKDTISFKGSLFNMMNEVIKYGYVNYIFCMKNNPDEREEVSLTFKKFTITKEKYREINIAYLRHFKFLDSFDAGKMIPDSNSIPFGAKTSVATDLRLLDIQDIATLKIGITNIRSVLEKSKTDYISLLLQSLEHLSNTTEELTKFIYTDNIVSGENAKKGAEQLSTSIGTAIIKRREKGVGNAQ